MILFEALSNMYAWFEGASIAKKNLVFRLPSGTFRSEHTTQSFLIPLRTMWSFLSNRAILVQHWRVLEIFTTI